ncbi:hypothetical protein [Imtechella halotolerans]|nr:hypothetical protein [Imtechella halotolerans]WMQ63456.1 hypothetical protein PT603_00435 [Imtechella halotolerans]
MSLWWLLCIPVLFVLVLANNRKNNHKLRNRKGRNFRENYHTKKNNQDNP